MLQTETSAIRTAYAMLYVYRPYDRLYRVVNRPIQETLMRFSQTQQTPLACRGMNREAAPHTRLSFVSTVTFITSAPVPVRNRGVKRQHSSSTPLSLRLVCLPVFRRS